MNATPLSLPAPSDPAPSRLAGERVLFCRAPGLLAEAAKGPRPENAFPLVVSDGRLVRDADAFALARGIHAGQPLAKARRLCPPLLVSPAARVSYRGG